MTSFLRSDRSTPVAAWLWFTALVVFCLVVVGGVTRLTDSGLSITQWKPISGALPPLSHQAWLDEFALYQRIPQYRLVNPDMTVESFKNIYWWEWSHRLLGRAVGVVFAVPFAFFLVRRQIPRRLIAPCCAMLGLGGLQGLVGWWMVSSGLSERVSVAPERLATHLGLALLLFVSLIWTGCSAFAGQPRQAAAGPWKRWTPVFLGAVYLQCLLGALVAGNDAGKVFNDWPLFNGAWWPQPYFGADAWATFAHSQGAVQAHHRLMAYAVFAAGLAIGVAGWRSRAVDRDVRLIALGVAAAVTLQAALGVATLMAAAPVWLGALHQAGGAGLLALAAILAWRVRRV